VMRGIVLAFFKENHACRATNWGREPSFVPVAARRYPNRSASFQPRRLCHHGTVCQRPVCLSRVLPDASQPARSRMHLCR
jgi:hypothetical protein